MAQMIVRNDAARKSQMFCKLSLLIIFSMLFEYSYVELLNFDLRVLSLILI